MGKLKNPEGIKLSGLWNKYFIILTIVAMLSGMAGKYYEATMSLQVSAMGQPAAFTGTLMMFFTITAAVFRMVAGKMADTRGRLFTILIGISVFIIPCAGFALFPDNYIMMIVFRAFQGMGFAITGAAFFVAASDTIPESRMGEGVGIFSLNSSVSSAIGPLLALPLFESRGFSAVSWLAVGTLVVSFGLSGLFCRYESDKKFAVEKFETPANEEKPPMEYKGIWKFIEKASMRPAAVVLLYSITISGPLSYMALFAKETGISNAALFFMFSAVSTVLIRLVAGKVDDRYGTLVAFLPGVGLVLASFAMLVIFTGNDIMYCVAAVLYGCGGGLVGPSLNTRAIRGVPSHRRGAAMATFNTPMEIGIAVGSILWGMLIDRLGYNSPFIGGGIAIIATGILGTILFSRKEKGKILK